VLETIVGVIVSALPSYRVLFRLRKRDPATDIYDQYGTMDTENSQPFPGTNATSISERGMILDMSKMEMMAVEARQTRSPDMSTEATTEVSREQV